MGKGKGGMRLEAAPVNFSLLLILGMSAGSTPPLAIRHFHARRRIPPAIATAVGGTTSWLSDRQDLLE